MALNISPSLKKGGATVAIVTLFIILCLVLRDATLDDSFISFRYAVHLAEGHGLVFNPGERVEGYSNLLWVLILAAWHALGVELEGISKIMGVFCGIATLLLAMHIFRRHFGAAEPLVIFLGLYLSTSIGMVYYAISGMETLFYAFQIILFAALIVKERPWLAAVTAATLLMTRPEGLLFIAPLALFLWMRRPRRLTPLALPILCLGALTVWRMLYYQSPLPNTFYAKIKTQSGILDYLIWHTRTFISYTWASFPWNEVLLFFAILYVLYYFRKCDLMLAAVLVCPLFFIWFSGFDWMSFGRFYVPALPLMALFAFAALGRLLQGDAGVRTAPWKMISGLTVLIVFNLVAFWFGAESVKTGANINPAMHSRAHRQIAHFLRRHADPGDVLVVNEVGVIGYLTETHIIDIIGLTDKTIPRFWKNQDLDAYADYVFSFRPRFIALNDRQEPADVTMHPMHLALYERMNHLGGYRLLATFPLNEYKNLLIYERFQEGSVRASGSADS